MPKAKIDNLTLDYTLYPRTSINDFNVLTIKDAMEAGVKMPPIVVCKKTRRVVDGYHRVKANQRLKKETIDVVYKIFKNDAQLYLEAISLNSSHGQKLSNYDKARIIERSTELKIAPEIIAGALNLSIAKLDKMTLTKTAMKDDQTITTIKGTLRHLSGRKLTKKQQEGNLKASGMSALFHVNQVINVLENDLLDKQNEILLDALLKLQKLIARKVKKVA